MKDGQGWLEWVLVRMPVTLIRLCRDTTQASARARLSGLRGIPSMWNTCSIRREGAARAHGILRVDIHDPKKAKYQIKYKQILNWGGAGLGGAWAKT